MARSDERAAVFPDPVIVPLDELMRQFGALPLAAVKKALAAQGLYVVTDADMRDYKESLALWKHWTEHDITEDDDRWAEFTNKVHALLARREGRMGD